VNSSADGGDRADRVGTHIAIKASAERVFEALTDPRQRLKWWRVAGKFVATVMESDLPSLQGHIETQAAGSTT
jgi:uncharacterized protein YndB with AHSA1/START domain